MSDIYRPLAEFPHTDVLRLAIRSLSHRLPDPGRHVWISASATSPAVMILTLKYGAIPNPEVRNLYPSGLVPESELQAMQYLHHRLGWRFHEWGAPIPDSSSFVEFLPRPTIEQVSEARHQILTELGLGGDKARDPMTMVSAEPLIQFRVPAPPAPPLKIPRRRTAAIDPHGPEREYARGEVAYLVFRDIETAKTHFHAAARRGNSKAQHRLATIYSEEQAYRTAIKWCRLAAWQGHLPAAQFDLARMYYYGYGVTRDLTEARKWMLHAAEAANADAMHGMGILSGDAVQSYAWFKLAARRKSADGAKAARELRASMTDEQVLQAKKLMAQLRNSIHRPSKRTPKPKPGAKYYVGWQEVMGSVCDWRVEYSVQRFGDDRWILYVKGEVGFSGRDGPMYADAMMETLEQRGLDVQEFLSQLLGSGQPTLRSLAQEIERAIGEEITE